MSGSKKEEQILAMETAEEGGSSDQTLLQNRSRIFPQLCAVVVVLLSPLSMGFVLGYSSPTLQQIREEIHLDPEQASWFSSIVTLGAILGGPLAAITIEKTGRKVALMMITLPYISGWLIIAFSEQYLVLYLGRFLTGLSIGATSLTAPVYIAEVVTENLRGFFGSAFQLFVNMGVLIVYALGIPLSYSWLALVLAAVPAVQVLLLLFMPETPRWLIKHGRREKALLSLRWLRGADFDISKECSQIESTVSSSSSRGAQMQDFLQPQLYQPLLISIMLMLFQQFSGINAVIFYTQDIFSSAGHDSNPEVATVIIGAVMVFATFLACCVMDCAGRRLLLITSSVFMTAGCSMLGTYYYLVQVEHTVVAGWLSLTSLIVYVSAFSIGWGPIPWLIMSEIFPVKAKGIASGLATTSNWLSCFVVTKEFVNMLEMLSEYGTYWLLSSICLLSAGFVWLVVPETKGKSLEEINRNFEKATNSSE